MHSKTVLNSVSCCSLLIILILACVGCGKAAPVDFYPALTAAAATNGSGSPNAPQISTQSATQTPQPIITARPEKCLAESKENSINLRRGPSGDIIGCCLARGERLEIQQVDSTGDWALIEGIDRPSHQGWVKLSFLSIIGDCKMGIAGQ